MNGFEVSFHCGNEQSFKSSVGCHWPELSRRRESIHTFAVASESRSDPNSREAVRQCCRADLHERRSMRPVRAVGILVRLRCFHERIRVQRTIEGPKRVRRFLILDSPFLISHEALNVLLNVQRGGLHLNARRSARLRIAGPLPFALALSIWSSLRSRCSFARPRRNACRGRPFPERGHRRRRGFDQERDEEHRRQSK